MKTKCPQCNFDVEPGQVICEICGLEISAAKEQKIETKTKPISKKNKKLIISVTILILSIFIYTQITIFVVPPIGAVPEGRTAIMLRLNKTNFIDSPDAMCVRAQGNVNLLCRGLMTAAVVNKSKILLRLPYSKVLYLFSTNGKTYTWTK